MQQHRLIHHLPSIEYLMPRQYTPAALCIEAMLAGTSDGVPPSSTNAAIHRAAMVPHAAIWGLLPLHRGAYTICLADC